MLHYETTRTQLRKCLVDTFNQTILLNRWIPYYPHPKQAEFLLDPAKEILYGGAAGGGKSDGLLMGGLQYVDIPGYAAIIFRRTYADLTKAGALIDRSLKWLGGSSAKWISQQHKWVFPSGASLEFGNLEREQDKYRYQSAEFQYIGFDELTQFEESQYRYLFSRLRRLEGVNIPLRMRSASNPGNIGHDWVKRRFMKEGHLYGRIFIPASLDDNPSLDKKEYVKSLDELDPITRRQYLLGDWTARHGGSIFLREWFKDKIVQSAPHDVRTVRYWDLAATKPKAGSDPDWTVGLKMGSKDGFFYVMDIQRFRGSPSTVEDRVKLTAKLDGVKTRVYMEQEPGSSGVSVIDYYHRKILSGYIFYGVKTTGSKSERAAPFSSACEGGLVKMVDGNWIGCYLDELEAFPVGSHDDQVDGSSGAFTQLTRHGNIEVGRGTLSW